MMASYHDTDRYWPTKFSANDRKSDQKFTCLRHYEHIGSCNNAFCYLRPHSIANFLFISVHKCSVNMPIAYIDSVLYRLFAVTFLCLKSKWKLMALGLNVTPTRSYQIGAQTKNWHQLAIAQSHWRCNTHYDKLYFRCKHKSSRTSRRVKMGSRMWSPCCYW